jgi:hypothetical protein
VRFGNLEEDITSPSGGIAPKGVFREGARTHLMSEQEPEEEEGMASRYDGLAEVRAKFYFQDILAWIRGLYVAVRSISSAIAALKKEFDAAVPRSRLILSAKSTQAYGPTSLQWAQLKSLGSPKNFLGLPAKPKVIGGLKGKLDPGWAYQIAHRHDQLPRFEEFDLRAAALNRARGSVFKAIRFLQAARVLRCSNANSPGAVPSSLNPDDLREVPAFPPECYAPDMASGFRLFLKGGWIASFTLGMAEEEFNELSGEVSRNPSANGVSLELADRSESSFVRQARWVHAHSRTIVPKLTHAMMKRLHIKEAVRPVLHQKELKRERIAERFEAIGGALDRLRQLCTTAQFEMSTGHAAATTSSVPGMGSGEQRVAS